MLIDRELHRYRGEGKQKKRGDTKFGKTASLGSQQVWDDIKCVCVCVGGGSDIKFARVVSQRYHTYCSLFTKTQDVLYHKDTRLVVSRLVVSRLVVSRLVVVCCGEFQSVVVCCRVLQSLAKCCRLLQNIAMIQDIHLHTHTPGGDVKTHIIMNI